MGKKRHKGTKIRKSRRALKVYSPGAEGKRRCGPCSACCVALHVPDLEKPEFTPCAHLRRGSGARFGACKIYADRPGNCRDWICGWIRGLGQAHHRPDKSGIVLDVEQSKAVGGFVVKVWEMKPGAVDRPGNRELVEAMCEIHEKPTIAIAFLPGGRRRLLGGNQEGARRAQAVLEAAAEQGQTIAGLEVD